MELKTVEEKTIVLTGDNLTMESFIKIVRYGHKVELCEVSEQGINKSRDSVDKLVNNGEVVYGLTTGFGSLSNVNISQENSEKLQKNLIMSHATGVGDPFSEEVVRGIMLLRINTFAKGFSGIRLSTVNTLVEMLNKGIYPFVPEKGSVGSSGDLAPISHMVLVMLGMGEAFVNGQRVPGIEAMRQAGIEPITLTSKEGLALNNGTPVMTSIGALCVHDAENLIRHSIISSSLSLDALNANSSFLFDKVHMSRPHKGQIVVAHMIRNMLEGSKLIDSDKTKVQDAYSVRATPVVVGASLDAIQYAKHKILIEMNSSTDNPLIFDDKAYSAGNFHGQPIALAMDFLGIAVSELANIAERRIFKILDPALNEGLPAFLIKNSGLNNGFMIPQYTAAALVSENKILAHPASVDSIPTCANQEDHVSMGTIAARKAREIIDNATKVLAIELMVAAQGVEMREKEPGILVKKVIENIRKYVDPMNEDRVIYPDMNKIEELINNRMLLNGLGVWMNF
jgi:histidine ammonia-lyase